MLLRSLPHSFPPLFPRALAIMSYFKSPFGKQGVPHQSLPATPTPSPGLHAFGRHGNAVPPSPAPPTAGSSERSTPMRVYTFGAHEQHDFAPPSPAPPTTGSSERSTPMRVYAFGAHEQHEFARRHESVQSNDPRFIGFDTPENEVQWAMANMQLPSVEVDTPMAPPVGPTIPPSSQRANSTLSDVDSSSNGNSSFTLPSGLDVDSPMADANTSGTSTSTSSKKKRARDNDDDDDSDDELTSCHRKPRLFKRTRR